MEKTCWWSAGVQPWLGMTVLNNLPDCTEDLVCRELCTVAWHPYMNMMFIVFVCFSLFVFSPLRSMTCSCLTLLSWAFCITFCSQKFNTTLAKKIKIKVRLQLSHLRLNRDLLEFSMSSIADKKNCHRANQAICVPVNIYSIHAVMFWDESITHTALVSFAYAHIFILLMES